MRLCVISSKACWQESDGTWYSYGGFPAQMQALSSLFESTTLLVVRAAERNGGIALPPRASVVGVATLAAGGLRRRLSLLIRLPRLIWLMLRYARQSDVVHIPLPGDVPLLGAVVAVLLKKKLLVRYGGSWQTDSQTSFMNKAVRKWIRLLAGGRNLVLATGEGDNSPGPQVHWIYATAVPESELATVQPRDDDGLKDPPELVFIGRLTNAKRVDAILAAMDRLRREMFRPIPRLTIIGDGPARSVLEHDAERRCLKEVVAFTGQLDRTELSARLAQADLCVQPSMTEGYSKAWLDALVHGVPVIASDVGSARAVVGHDGERGWVVAPGDVSALTRVLREVLNRPSGWSAIRSRCRHYAEQRTLESWAQRIGSLGAEQWGVACENGRLR